MAEHSLPPPTFTLGTIQEGSPGLAAFKRKVMDFPSAHRQSVTQVAFVQRTAG
jgi:hypothetical protein